LLYACVGLPAAIVEAAAPRGAGPDDLLDALASAWVARRIALGRARSFPDPPERDQFDLPMAILGLMHFTKSQPPRCLKMASSLFIGRLGGRDRARLTR